MAPNQVFVQTRRPHRSHGYYCAIAVITVEPTFQRWLISVRAKARLSGQKKNTSTKNREDF